MFTKIRIVSTAGELCVVVLPRKSATLNNQYQPMKKSLLRIPVLVLLLFSVPVYAQSLLYWDIDGAIQGAGGGDAPAGIWDMFTPNWSINANGTADTAEWLDGNIAVFAAGTTATGSYSVTLSGTLTASAVNVEEGTVTLTGGNLDFSGSSTIDVAAGSAATVSSVVGGSSVLTKTSAGTLALTANNTFTAGIAVNEGVLSFSGESSATVGSANPLGIYPASATPGYITLNAGTTLRSTRLGTTAGTSSFLLANRGVAISGGVYLEMTDATTNTALLGSSIIAGTDGLTKIGGGTILLAAANTYSGDTTFKAGGLGVNGTARFGDGTGTLIWDGGDVYSSGTRSFANGLMNPILMKTNVTLRAFNNSFTTGTRVLNFRTTNIVATNGTFTLENRGAAGTLFIVQFNTMGGLQFTRPIVLGAGCRFDLWNDNTATDAVFSGNISGQGNMQYTSSGLGTGGSTIVTGFNTYTGTNSLNGGYLGFGSDTLPATGPITSGPIGTSTLFVRYDPTVGIFAHGAARTVRNPVTFATVDHLRIIGTNDLTMQGALTFNSSNLTFTVDNTGITTFSAPISGGTPGRTFTKAGAGTLVFGGDNTYILPTTISAGTLLVNNSTGSGTGTGNVTVDVNATLGGTGTISGLVTANGNISPGTSAGILTLGNGLDLSGGGTCVWELAANSTSNAGTDFDRVVLTGGNLILGGASKLSLNFTGAATVPDANHPFWQTTRSWTVVALSGSAANPGASKFASLEGTNAITAGTFATSVNGSGSIILTYTPGSPVTPQPVIHPAISGAGTTSAVLSWSAVNGVTYQVQFKDDLNTVQWSILGNVTASGGIASITDTTSPVPAKRFYRIQVQ
jgi:fibronectin-binding autotransporter adhesin